jgi:hypothetical protein
VESEKLDGIFATRAYEKDIRRWKREAKARGMRYGVWVRLALDEACKRGDPRANPVARAPEVVGVVGGGRTEETRVAVAGPVRSLDSYERGRDVARELAQKEGRCTADVTKGVRCRLCGKTH